MTALDRDAIVEAMARAEFEHETPPDEGTWNDSETRWKAEYTYRCKAALDAARPMIGEWLAKDMHDAAERLPHTAEGAIYAGTLDAASARIRALCAGVKSNDR